MSWASTAWGKVCTEVHAYLLPEYPTLVLGIGPDEWARHDAMPRVLFAGPGMSFEYRTRGLNIDVPDETIEQPIKGSRPGRNGIFDRVCPILAMIAWPFNGNETTPDTSAVECEDLYERFLAAISFNAYVRASEVASAKWFGGSAGKNGTAVQVSFSLRFAVYDNPIPNAKATSTTVTSTSLAEPGGTIVETVVPGV